MTPSWKSASVMPESPTSTPPAVTLMVTGFPISGVPSTKTPGVATPTTGPPASNTFGTKLPLPRIGLKGALVYKVPN